MNALKQIRNFRGLSQEALAKKIGVNTMTIGNYETGKTNPDTKSLCAMADVLEVSTDTLLGRKEININ